MLLEKADVVQVLPVPAGAEGLPFFLSDELDLFRRLFVLLPKLLLPVSVKTVDCR